jgi:hypothetical protein
MLIRGSALNKLTYLCRNELKKDRMVLPTISHKIYPNFVLFSIVV